MHTASAHSERSASNTCALIRRINYTSSGARLSMSSSIHLLYSSTTALRSKYFSRVPLFYIVMGKCSMPAANAASSMLAPYSMHLLLAAHATAFLHTTYTPTRARHRSPAPKPPPLRPRGLKSRFILMPSSLDFECVLL